VPHYHLSSHFYGNVLYALSQKFNRLLLSVIMQSNFGLIKICATEQHAVPHKVLRYCRYYQMVTFHKVVL